MKLIKYDHVCFVLEDQEKKLIVDPGSYEDLPADITNVVAVVVTHEHPDHFSPEVQVFASEEAAAQTEGAIAPERGKPYEAGPFILEFSGDMHAQIHEAYPSTHNISVLINDSIYYPGDVLLAPSKPVKVLLMPTSAPWMKVAEGMDFLTEVKAPLVIPTHDALISEKYGKPLYDRLLGGSTEAYGGRYQRLQPGESITL
jgi:L-ascorbate metabolism protein UlaG (beta-lactamase superfamily)